MEKDGALISIVVPIYNVEEYIAKCLDTLIGQTYENLEIILVDDGSPDRAGEICDDYAANDSRIIVHHLPNGGVAKARQFGVENSSGEFIVFVDPDDYLPLDAVEKLYLGMTDDVDLVKGAHTRLESDGGAYTVETVDATYSVDEWRKLVFRIYLAEGTPWGKLYRRSLFTKESFPNMRLWEDWLMNLDLSMRIKRVRYISDIVYYYYSGRPGSTTTKNPPNAEYWGEYSRLIFEILSRAGKFETYEYEYYTINRMLIKRALSPNVGFSLKDKWVYDTYRYLWSRERSMQERFVNLLLKYPTYKCHMLMLKVIAFKRGISSFFKRK